MTVSKGNNNSENINQTEEVFVFPASYGQKRMWFLDQFEPGSPYYNIPVAFKIKGKFSEKEFIDTIEYMVKRHESFRTTFTVIKGDPHQVISPNLKIDIPIIDISDTSASDIENVVIKNVTDEARLPFNLEKGPLFRVKVLRLTPDEHVITITMHHIISDGWSMGILVGEITKIYTSLLTGKSITLPELEIM
jgi:NRPS condensation-like uncharacterized protein